MKRSEQIVSIRYAIVASRVDGREVRSFALTFWGARREARRWTRGRWWFVREVPVRVAIIRSGDVLWSWHDGVEEDLRGYLPGVGY